MSESESLTQLIERRAAELQSDGCSSSPDLFYSQCCKEHDIYYRTGKDLHGNTITRAQADARLFECMRKAGKTILLGKLLLPVAYWMAVRIFGRVSYGKFKNVV